MATPTPSKLIEYACPLKLFHYMAAGLPVIGTDIGEMGMLIRKHNIGIPIKFDKEELAGKVVELINNSSLRADFSKNGREAVKQYDWSVLLDKFGKILSEVTHANRD